MRPFCRFTGSAGGAFAGIEALEDGVLTGCLCRIASAGKCRCWTGGRVLGYGGPMETVAPVEQGRRPGSWSRLAGGGEKRAGKTPGGASLFRRSGRVKQLGQDERSRLLPENKTGPPGESPRSRSKRSGKLISSACGRQTRWHRGQAQAGQE